MYRISRVFETPSVAIVKLAGQIADSEAEAWIVFLKELQREPPRSVVLDFCEVQWVGRKAADILVDLLPKNILLLNCPVGIKNLISSAGYSSQLLETEAANREVQGSREEKVHAAR